MNKTLLLDFDSIELQEWVRASGEPTYRARQLLDWLYKKHAVSVEELSNLPLNWRERLARSVELTPFAASSSQQAQDGTKKYLFQLHDGESIESVRIPMKEHYTLCISTQVGCAVNCDFCLTGQQGFTRNLTSGEILGQILHVQRELSSDDRISNIVLMGMGEPLLNYQHTVKAIRMMLAEEGLNFSNRKITLSTAGIIPGIQQLGREEFTINLAISLNAPTDDIRSRLMPINRTYPLAKLLDACRAYPLPERRRITFEYILLYDINDAPEHAKILTKILQGIRCKINLIPYNATSDNPYRSSPEKRILAFQEILSQHGYSAFIRASKGRDISAACGQLRGHRQAG
jgi:23S rRNA (adenine2503-C2)-methyltransferase